MGTFDNTDICSPCEKAPEASCGTATCSQYYLFNNGTVDAPAKICIPIDTCSVDQFFNTTVDGINKGTCAECTAANDITCLKCPNFYYDAAATTPSCVKSPPCSIDQFYNNAATPAGAC
jgi:hypothetical protein